MGYLHVDENFDEKLRGIARFKGGFTRDRRPYLWWSVFNDGDVLRKEAEAEFAHSRRYLRALADENGLREERLEIRLLCAHPGFFAVFVDAAS